jgi:hypothetical protein
LTLGMVARAPIGSGNRRGRDDERRPQQ